MLVPIFILCLSHIILAGPVQPEFDVENIELLKFNFNDFKVKHNRTYTAVEAELRLSYFKANLAEINELRKRNLLAEFEINKFADWSPKEKEQLLGFKGVTVDDDLGKCTSTRQKPIKSSGVPDSLDYRDRNAVTPVQNQLRCGSCWAFSATGAVEGAYALKHQKLLKLSEQQLVDCDQDSYGCEGGLMHYAFSTLIEQGGQQLETDYPYTGKDNECTFDSKKEKIPVSACQLYENIDEEEIGKLLVSGGPIAIALDANPFISYSRGILSDCNYKSLSHAVLIVGYGEEHDIRYWLIKNSWGTNWGEEGYVKVERGKSCLGIGQYVSTVQVE